MEQVFTACQDGDLSGLMARMNTTTESSEDDVNDTETVDEKPEYLPEV